MHKKRREELEEVASGNLLSMCLSCDWLKQGKCKGIRKDSIQEDIVVVKSEHFAVIGKMLSIPRCPKIPINFQSN
jgi:hypothetical protein